MVSPKIEISNFYGFLCVSALNISIRFSNRTPPHISGREHEKERVARTKNSPISFDSGSHDTKFCLSCSLFRAIIHENSGLRLKGPRKKYTWSPYILRSRTIYLNLSRESSNFRHEHRCSAGHNEHCQPYTSLITHSFRCSADHNSHSGTVLGTVLCIEPLNHNALETHVNKVASLPRLTFFTLTSPVSSQAVYAIKECYFRAPLVLYS